MIRNIRELIDQLEDLAEEHGDATEVRLAFQPSWPFEHSIADVVATEQDDDEGEDDDVARRPDGDGHVVVYIGEGRQIGYLPGAGARALGWGRRR